MTRFVLILLIGLLAASTANAADSPQIVTRKDDKGWQLLVDGEPFVIRGVTYTPTTIGESSDNNTRRDWMMVDDDKDGRNDFAYQTWVDTNANGTRDADEPEVGDFELMKRMGVNAVRVYHHSSDDPQLKTINRNGDALLNHPPNKKLLRDLYERFGIRTAMGDLIGSYTVGSGADWDPGTDYTNRAQRTAMLHSVEVMVRDFKDEPYILMWVLGNENNFQEYTHTQAAHQMQAYAEFVNEAAALIKKLDGRHPIAVCYGGIDGLETLARYASNVDIFGTNLYRNNGFQELWKKLDKLWDRPVMLTEYGTARPIVINGVLNEPFQAKIHKAAWEDIARHTYGNTEPGNAIGGFAFEWVDEWWFSGEPARQNTAVQDNGWNLEYNGLTAMSDGPRGSLSRRLREVYRMYEELWAQKRN